MIDGSVTIGPNAVLGFSREGYAKGSVDLDSKRQLHVCNAPSPAATSAIPIGRMIADRLAPPQR